MTDRPSGTNTCLTFLLSALLLVQGAMPAGYMPASVSSGWPVMLCPEGLPAGFLTIRPSSDAAAMLHAHHQSPTDGASITAELDGQTGHGEHQAGEHASSSYCPLGSAVNAAVIAELAQIQSSTRHPDIPATPDYSGLLVAGRFYHASPRAPPFA